MTYYDCQFSKADGALVAQFWTLNYGVAMGNITRFQW